VQVWSATCWHCDVKQTDYRRCSRSIDDTTGTLIIPRVKYSVLYFCRRLGPERKPRHEVRLTRRSWSLGIGEARSTRPCATSIAFMEAQRLAVQYLRRRCRKPDQWKRSLVFECSIVQRMLDDTSTGPGQNLSISDRAGQSRDGYFWTLHTQRVMAGITRTSAARIRLDRLSTTMCTVECWGRCSTSSGPAEVRLIANEAK
jgi:hypothetical protein